MALCFLQMSSGAPKLGSAISFRVSRSSPDERKEGAYESVVSLSGTESRRKSLCNLIYPKLTLSYKKKYFPQLLSLCTVTQNKVFTTLTFLIPGFDRLGFICISETDFKNFSALNS